MLLGGRRGARPVRPGRAVGAKKVALAGVSKGSLVKNVINRVHDTHTDTVITSEGTVAALKSGQSFSTTESYERFNKYPSDNLPANVFGPQGAQFDCRIAGKPTGTLKHIEFEFTIFNPNADEAMTLCDPSVWFPRIDVLPDGGTVASTYYDLFFYLSKMTVVTDEQRAQMAKGYTYNPVTDRNIGANTEYRLHNYDAPVSSLFTIPANSSKVFYVVYDTFLNSSNLFMPALTDEPRFRFYTGNNIQTKGSAAIASTPVLVSVNTYMRGIDYTPEVRDSMTETFSGRDSVTRCCVMERQTISTTITSNQETQDKQLTGLTGKYSHLFIIVNQSAGFSQNSLYSDYDARDNTNGVHWKKLKDITLLDSNQNAWNFNKIPADYLKNVVWNNHFKSSLPFEKELYLLSFSNCAQLSQQHGADLGTATMDINWILRFTPISATDNLIPDNLNVTIQIIGARVCEFIQTKDGRCVFRKVD